MIKIGSVLDRDYFLEISGYLQHMTERRKIHAKKWALPDMHRRLEPAIVLFQRVASPRSG